jgi:hypothetical protein
MVLDRARQEDDAFLEQAGIDVVGAFTAIGLFHNHRHECHSGIDWVSHVRPFNVFPAKAGNQRKMPYPYIECPRPPLQDTHKDNVKKGARDMALTFPYPVSPKRLLTARPDLSPSQFFSMTG